jgi:hypothetical protein
MLYYKNLYEKEIKNNSTLKATLKEAEILIKKYQVQLQRALGNIDILSEEMQKLTKNLNIPGLPKLNGLF